MTPIVEMAWREDARDGYSEAIIASLAEDGAFLIVGRNSWRLRDVNYPLPSVSPVCLACQARAVAETARLKRVPPPYVSPAGRERAEHDRLLEAERYWQDSPFNPRS